MVGKSAERMPYNLGLDVITPAFEPALPLRVRRESMQLDVGSILE